MFTVTDAASLAVQAARLEERRFASIEAKLDGLRQSVDALSLHVGKANDRTATIEGRVDAVEDNFQLHLAESATRNLWGSIEAMRTDIANLKGESRDEHSKDALIKTQRSFLLGSFIAGAALMEGIHYARILFG